MCICRCFHLQVWGIQSKLVLRAPRSSFGEETGQSDSISVKSVPAVTVCCAHCVLPARFLSPQVPSGAFASLGFVGPLSASGSCLLSFCLVLGVFRDLRVVALLERCQMILNICS